MDQTIFSFLFDTIGTTVESFVNDASSTMIGILGPLAAALFTIYVLLWGSALASGQVSEPFTDGMKRVVRMAIIIALATTVGVYQDMVASTLKEGPMQVAQHLSFSGTPATADANAMGVLLDTTLSDGLKVAQRPWEKGAAINGRSVIKMTAEGLMLQVLAIVLGLIAIIVTCVAAGIVFVAYMAMAVLLGIGPLFILFAIFPATQRWAEAWLGQVVNYGILFILVSLTSSLLFSMLSEYFSGLAGSVGAGGSGDEIAAVAEAMWVTLKAIGLAVAMIAVLLQLNSIAAGLAGGAAIQTANVAGKLAGMGMGAAVAAQAGARMGRSALGHARAFNAGRRGEALPNKFPRTSRELAHAAGGIRARQKFQQRNTIEGT